MTHRLRILADLPNIVDLVREETLSFSDEMSPWHRRVADIYQSSGKTNFLRKLLTIERHSNGRENDKGDWDVIQIRKYTEKTDFLLPWVEIFNVMAEVRF